MCREAGVESILPNYSKSLIETQGSGESGDVPSHTADCVLDKSSDNSNHSITFKQKVSLNILYHIVTKMELAKLSDETLIFNFYYSIWKNNQIIMTVEMNTKALNMVGNT